MSFAVVLLALMFQSSSAETQQQGTASPKPVTAVENVTNSTTVPSPYFFQSGQPNIVVGPTPGPLNNLSNTTGSFGISATSIANIHTGQP